MAKILTCLAAYHILFFWKFYKNPWLLSTSEVASTYFPRWKSGIKLFDNYYHFPAGVSFLSTFYPPNFLSSWLFRRLPMDLSFRLYVYVILAHYLLGSILAYLFMAQFATPLASLFGAITLTYAAYQIKPQTPEYAFTMMWVPGIMIKGWVGKVSLGMALLGGYYPPLVYVLPFALLANPSAIWDTFLGLPQVVPFLWYWVRSIRSGANVENQGAGLKPLDMLNIAFPWPSQTPSSGIHYPEFAMYMGLTPLFFVFHRSLWLVPLLYSVSVVLGILPSIQRIPARALYLLTLSIACLSCIGASALQENHLLGVLIVQCFLLLPNVDIYPSIPFSQWWDKPSKLYQRPYSHTKWPFFTGYLWGGKTDGYKGAFRLKDSWQTTLS